MKAKQQAMWTGFAFAVLAASAALSNATLFNQKVHTETNLTRQLPTKLGEWQAIAETPASASEIRGLETRDIIKRTYTNGDAYVELVVAYIAHSDRKSAHAQEACLRGSGAMVGSIQRRNLLHSPVNATVISIDNSSGRSWVYYWYKIGKTYTSDYLKSSFMMFLGGLVGKQTQGASLIRLLTPTTKGEPEAAIHERMENFTALLLPELERLLP